MSVRIAVLTAWLIGVAASLPRALGQAKASKSFRELFAKTRAINLMAAARAYSLNMSAVQSTKFMIQQSLDRFRGSRRSVCRQADERENGRSCPWR